MRSSVRGGGRRSLGMVAVKGGKCIAWRQNIIQNYHFPWSASQLPASQSSSFTLHQAPERRIRVAVLAFTCAGVDKHEAP